VNDSRLLFFLSSKHLTTELGRWSSPSGGELEEEEREEEEGL